MTSFEKGMKEYLMDRIEFGVRMAGIPFRVRTESEKTRAFFNDFLYVPALGETVPVLEASEEDLARAEKQYKNTLRQKGEAVPDRIGRIFLELTAVHEKMTLALLPHNVFLVHGSALCMDGRAYVFTAPSGTGKSTHARLWREVYGNRVRMINDDKPYIRYDAAERTFLVCGSPWRGKHGLGSNMEAPLGGICILHRAGENSMKRIPAEEALPELLPQIYRPSGREDMVRTLAFTGSLLDQIPVYTMRCNMELSAARLSCSVLTGRELSRQDLQSSDALCFTE